jgi:hypothetical protein
MTVEKGLRATPSDTPPNPVTPDITHDSLGLHFLPYAVCHLCYDGVVHERGGQTPGSWCRCATIDMVQRRF